MAITQRRLTLEEFLALPEQKPVLEYWEGVVTQKVSPKGPHGRLQLKLGALLEAAAAPRKLAMVFTEVRATYADSSLVPDIAVYLWDRVPRTARGRVADDFVLTPDIAIEIVSPGQSVISQARRCRWYVEQGAKVALAVNPRNDSVTEVQAGGIERVLRGNDRLDLSPVLPDFALTVQELFDSLTLD